jgi:alpha 1,2-mannosyltransferase
MHDARLVCPALSSPYLRNAVLCRSADTIHHCYFVSSSDRFSPSWDKATSSASIEQARVQDALASFPAYPADEFHGRGIIMVAGGDYLRDAMVTIAAIRDFGCKLRVQVWHNGEREIPATTLGFFDKYGVETYNLADYGETKDIKTNVGSRPFQLKPLALLHTDFEEVLMLDADSTPVTDPTFLFEDKRYKATGSLFWPDYWTTHSANPIFTVTGVEQTVEREMESGQMVVNKAVAWTAINLVNELQTDLYYSLVNGDKDTFKFAWKIAGVPFTMNEYNPAAIGMDREHMVKDGTTGFCGHSMGQHDFDGNLLFVHHNQLKLSWGWSKGAYFTAAKHAANKDAKYRVVSKPAVTIGDQDITCFDMEFATATGVQSVNAVDSELEDWTETYFGLFDEVKMYFPVSFIDRHRRKVNATSTAAPATTIVAATTIAPTAAPTTAAPTAPPITVTTITATTITATTTTIPTMVNIVSVAACGACDDATAATAAAFVVESVQNATGLIDGETVTSAYTCLNGALSVDMLYTKLDLTVAEVSAFELQIMTALPSCATTTVSSRLVDIAADFKIPSCGGSSSGNGKHGKAAPTGKEGKEGKGKKGVWCGMVAG